MPARPTKGRPLLFSHALRRPLISTAVAAGIVAATAAGYASSSPNIAKAAFSLTAGSTAADTGVSAQQVIKDEYQNKVTAAGLQRQAVEAEQARLAKAAAGRLAARKAAALAAARKAAAVRTSRAKARASIVAQARTNPHAIASLLAADMYGWNGSQVSCLSSLWNKESGWKYTASNSGSGAYGIPQALPGSKMASAGADWRTNPATQIKWGLTYINDRYGSPCAAWGHSQSVGWY